MSDKIPDLFPNEGKVTRAMRGELARQQGLTIWLTGLSGSGKSTISRELEYRLWQMNHLTYVLDGDNIRLGINRDLGFSEKDRTENIRRVGEVARLFSDAGLITIVAFISPFRADRDSVRALFPPGAFVEAYIDCPIAVCEKRDPKGLYAKARRGEVPHFTGISSPYEPPMSPEIILKTGEETPAESVEKIFEFLKKNRLIRE